MEVGRLGSWKREFLFRFCASAMPKRDNRFWQQKLLCVSFWDAKGWKLWQVEEFQGTVST